LAYFREFVQSTTACVGSTWSDCGHNTWRPGIVLDPFAGSGTTLMVATGMGRDAIGIDLDERNADLARERIGMFVDIEHHNPKEAA
jgi:DNA modification methylase